jgi:nicotinamide riboside kinase
MAMKVINLFGAPGSGKSTMAARIFADMKCRGIKVEYTDEYAKRKVYEGNSKALGCQPYIMAQQLYKLEILENDADFVITDSPVLLSCLYNSRYPQNSFNHFTIDAFNQFNNNNLVLLRDYKSEVQGFGRIHNHLQCVEIQNRMMRMLDSNRIEYTVIDQFTKDITPIVEGILSA